MYKARHAAAKQPTLTGYYSAATTSKWRTAVARVIGNSGRAKLLVLGDSTSVGQGAGTGSYGLANARVGRPAAVLANLLTTAGLRARDTSIVGTGRLPGDGPSLESYSGTVMGYESGPRISCSQGGDGTSYPGGFLIFGNDGQLLSMRDSSCDKFEIIRVNNSTTGFFSSFVDTNSSQYDRPLPGGSLKFDKFTHPAVKSVGAHTLQMATSSTNYGDYIASITAYDSTQSAVDILVSAACGITSGQLASSNGEQNLDWVKFIAPDMTIINIGLNDINVGVSASTYAANLHTLITAAKISGDVLVLFAPQAYGSFSNMAAHEAAARTQAAMDNVPFFSFREYYGSANLASRYYDSIVHPNAAFYAEIADVQKQVLKILAPF